MADSKRFSKRLGGGLGVGVKIIPMGCRPAPTLFTARAISVRFFLTPDFIASPQTQLRQLFEIEFPAKAFWEALK
jgi:hypothetical protein